VKIRLPAKYLAALSLLACTALAAAVPAVVSLGSNTFSITRQANNGFDRDTDRMKEEALHDAEAYCASLGKQMKLISATAEKPKLIFTGYTKAKVVFKALDANDPELHAPLNAGNGSNGGEGAVARSGTDSLYNDLMKLDDLRKKGILTEEEFQAQKKKVLERN
jgi:hypothetical protein